MLLLLLLLRRPMMRRKHGKWRKHQGQFTRRRRDVTD